MSDVNEKAATVAVPASPAAPPAAATGGAGL